MRFEEALNGYIHQIGITAKDLADASGLSTAVISRYRSGERTPAPDGEPLLNLSKGLARLAQRKGMDGFTQPELLSALQKSLRYDEKEGNRLAVNFDLLINVLNLRSSDMARALNFDPPICPVSARDSARPRIPPRLRKVWVILRPAGAQSRLNALRLRI